MIQIPFEVVMGEIVSECRNGCIDERSTFEHFARRKIIQDRASIESVFVAFIKSLNYSAIRENSEALSIAFPKHF